MSEHTRLRELTERAMAQLVAMGRDGTFYQNDVDAEPHSDRATELSELLCFFEDEGQPRVWDWPVIGKYLAAASPANVSSLLRDFAASQRQIKELREAAERVIAWAGPIAGDNRDDEAAAEEEASIAALRRALSNEREG